MMKTFADYGIDVPGGATGEIRTTCPSCSPNRKKSSDKCLAINVDKGTWFCQHCAWSGGLGSDEQKAPTLTPAPKTYRRPEYKPTATLPEQVIKYFATRGISQKTLTDNQIGYGEAFKGKNGVRFPYFKDGVVVNIKHRTSDKQFRQEKDAEKCLYRLDEIAKAVASGNDTVIITEGEMDCLSLCECGFNNAASIPDGAPSADAKTFNTKFDFLISAESILAKCKKVILATDNDAPGLTCERELARRIGVEKCYRVKYPDGCKDANDVLKNHGKDSLLAVIRSATPYPIEGIISPVDLLGDMLSVYDKGFQRGVAAGWPELDPFYTVRPCEMTVVTGIPGSGKSQWLDSLMINLSQLHGWSFGVFSPENWPVERHLQGLVEKLTGRPFARDGIYTRRLSKDELSDSIEILDRHIKFIAPKNEILSIDMILEKAKVLIFRHGINGLVIDPWNELEHLYGKLTETQYISEQLSKLRIFARMNGIHVWIVAHPRNLSKDENGNYKPPSMYEISGGAHWRNKADNGICIHRPDFDIDETEVYVQKIRFREVGKVGMAKLKYCRETGNYT